MSYKEREVTSVGYSRLGAEAKDGALIQRDLNEYKTIKGGDVLIPFHAVDRAVITTSMVERADRNPYGCTADDGGSAACVAKTCSARVGC